MYREPDKDEIISRLRAENEKLRKPKRKITAPHQLMRFAKRIGVIVVVFASCCVCGMTCNSIGKSWHEQDTRCQHYKQHWMHECTAHKDHYECVFMWKTMQEREYCQ